MSNLTNKINENRQIVIANQINESRFRMSRAEQKLILYCIAIVDNKEGKLALTFEMDIQDFADFLDIKRKDFYNEMKELTADFAGRVFEIKLPNGRLRQIPALSMVEYYKGRVTLKINPELAPYLLDLKSKFTRYSLQEALSFKSGFSMRIYQLLAQYKYKEEVEYTVEKLRFCLNIDDDKFERFFDFKRFVLDVAQKEINEKSSLKFEYKLIKKGKKTLVIKFIITQAVKPDLSLLKNIHDPVKTDQTETQNTENEQLEDLQPPLNPINNSNSTLKLKLEKLGFGENQIKKFLKESDQEKIENCTDYVAFKLQKEIDTNKTKNKIESPTGYFFTIYNAYEDIDFSSLTDYRKAEEIKQEEERKWQEEQQRQKEEEELKKAQTSQQRILILEYMLSNPREVNKICEELVKELEAKNSFNYTQVQKEAKKNESSLIDAVKTSIFTKFLVETRIWAKINPNS